MAFHDACPQSGCWIAAPRASRSPLIHHLAWPLTCCYMPQCRMIAPYVDELAAKHPGIVRNGGRRQGGDGGGGAHWFHVCAQGHSGPQAAAATLLPMTWPCNDMVGMLACNAAVIATAAIPIHTTTTPPQPADVAPAQSTPDLFPIPPSAPPSTAVLVECTGVCQI